MGVLTAIRYDDNYCSFFI